MLARLISWAVDTTHQLTLIFVWILRDLIDQPLAHAFWVAVPMVIQDIVPAAEVDDSKTTGAHDVSNLRDMCWEDKREPTSYVDVKCRAVMNTDEK